MKELIGDDAEVMRICERLGVDGAVKDSIRRGKTIAFICDGYVIARFIDGLIAAKTADPIEAIEVLSKIAKTIGVCSAKAVRR